MARIVRNDPYLTREDTGGDKGQTPAIQHYEKQNGSDGATSNTVFTLSKPYVQGSYTLVIYIDGVKAEWVVGASAANEYDETSSSTVTFGASLGAGDVVEFMIYGTYFIQDTDIYVTKANQNNSNVIINGDFNIWQRGTNFASVANGAFTADRFFYGKVGTMVHNIYPFATVPTQAESGHLSNDSLVIDCTTADASIAAGDVCIQQYRVEGYDFAQLVGNWGTLSFWVRCTKTGTYCVAFLNSGNDRSYVVEYEITAADTFQKVTIPVNFNETGGTWDYENGVGITIAWALACGSTYQTTADAWQTGQYFATSNQVNACDNTANNFFLSQVKLEQGQDATPFISRPYAEELALCQRYFIKFTDDGDALFSGYARKTNGSFAMCNFPVEMRTENPTVTYSTATYWSVIYGNSSTVACSALANGGTTNKTLLIQADHATSPLIQGDGLLIWCVNNGGGYVYIDSEL